MTVDRDGDIYIADWANHRVQLFNSSGLFVEKFIGDATLSDQARGYMITNLMAMRLREMTAIEPQKRFRWPVSVTVADDGRMYVPDYGSQRIQVYRKDVITAGAGGDCADAAVAFVVYAVLGLDPGRPICRCRQPRRDNHPLRW